MRIKFPIPIFNSGQENITPQISEKFRLQNALLLTAVMREERQPSGAHNFVYNGETMDSLQNAHRPVHLGDSTLALTIYLCWLYQK